jgi:hypothetical protein
LILTILLRENQPHHIPLTALRPSSLSRQLDRLNCPPTIILYFIALLLYSLLRLEDTISRSVTTMENRFHAQLCKALDEPAKRRSVLAPYFEGVACHQLPYHTPSATPSPTPEATQTLQPTLEETRPSNPNYKAEHTYNVRRYKQERRECGHINLAVPLSITKSTAELYTVRLEGLERAVRSQTKDCYKGASVVKVSRYALRPTAARVRHKEAATQRVITNHKT